MFGAVGEWSYEANHSRKKRVAEQACGIADDLEINYDQRNVLKRAIHHHRFLRLCKLIVNRMKIFL